MKMMHIAKLKQEGLARVLDGRVGMTFIVDKFTDGVAGKVAHVRDYRWPPETNMGRPFVIWSIAADGYELITE